jgi:hypothetical protein
MGGRRAKLAGHKTLKPIIFVMAHVHLEDEEDIQFPTSYSSA